MRLLVDESLPARLADLPEAGHDAVHLGSLGLLGERDEVVLSTAVEQERVVITADTDFGTLLALSGSAFPSVVLLRRGGRAVQQRAQHVALCLDLTENALNAGALVVAEHTRLRIRSLPIDQTATGSEWRTL